MHNIKHIGVLFVTVGVGILLGSLVFDIQQRARPLNQMSRTTSSAPAALQKNEGSTTSILLNQSSPINNP